MTNESRLLIYRQGFNDAMNGVIQPVVQDSDRIILPVYLDGYAGALVHRERQRMAEIATALEPKRRAA